MNMRSYLKVHRYLIRSLINCSTFPTNVSLDWFIISIAAATVRCFWDGRAHGVAVDDVQKEVGRVVVRFAEIALNAGQTMNV